MNQEKKFIEANLARDYPQVKEAETGLFDLLIIGGGIHGAWLARDATLRGFRVLLLEAQDFGHGTSSRSSKMLHGGVRYLENGDIKLVFDALAERSRVSMMAKHLSTQKSFYYPIIKGATRPAWQTRIGLTSYDLLAKISAKLESLESFPTHRRVGLGEKGSQELKEFGLNFEDLFEYYDGQMNDARIVLEAVCDARELGGTTLNYAPVKKLTRQGSNWNIRWERGGENYSSKAKFVINTTGPWSDSVQNLIAKKPAGSPQLVLSRGIHLLFDIPWNRPGVILPTGEKGRYYFIWPHFHPGSSSTLVGTTDRVTKICDEDPVADPEEIEELFSYLQRDIPNSALNPASFYKSFCGIRALAASPKGSNAKASTISRSEVWIGADGWLTLCGGKFTNARSTAETGIDRFEKIIGSKAKTSKVREEIRTRPLPGSVSLNKTDLAQASKVLGEANLDWPRDVCCSSAASCFARFGVKIGDIITRNNKENLESARRSVLSAEIRYTLLNEQAITVQDVLSRRLGLSYLPDCDVALSDEVVKIGLEN